MIKVYVASPYTKGDVAKNVKAQMDAVDRLYGMGLNAFWPLHSHFQHMVHPRDYNFWMKIDYDWIDACDVILRLPGVSEGADMESEYAEKRDIPVFTNFLDLEYYINNRR